VPEARLTSKLDCLKREFEYTISARFERAVASSRAETVFKNDSRHSQLAAEDEHEPGRARVHSRGQHRKTRAALAAEGVSEGRGLEPHASESRETGSS
jgi:hypothetical protein